jgi:acyl carrier protein
MTRPDDLLEPLSAIVRRHLPAGSDATVLPHDRDLFELGLDSLNAVRMLLDVEEAFDIQFPESDISVELFSSLISLRTALWQCLEGSRT